MPLRFDVGGKFALGVGVLLLSVVTVAGIGSVGLTRMEARVSELFDENLATTLATADLAGALDEVNVVALQLIPTPVTRPPGLRRNLITF